MYTFATERLSTCAVCEFHCPQGIYLMNWTEDKTTAASGSGKNRRRKYIVDAGFQWRHAMTIGLMVFFITSTMSSLLYAVLHHQARLRFVNPDTYTGEVALVVLLAALAFSMVTAGGVVVWCVIATHRICGPLLVLERYLGQLAEGRFPSPRPLRRKDEFKGLYQVFTHTIQALKIRKETEFAALTEALESAKSAMGGDNESCRSTVALLVSRLEKLRNEAAKCLGDEVDSQESVSVAEPQPPSRIPVSIT